MIPKMFNRSQIVAITMFLVLSFVYFRKDINVYLDQADAYSVAHPELGLLAMNAIMLGAVCGSVSFAGIVVYIWKIVPWGDRRFDAKLERERFEKIKEQLEQSWPRILTLEHNMESFSIMLGHEQYRRNIGRRRK